MVINFDFPKSMTYVSAPTVLEDDLFIADYINQSSIFVLYKNDQI